MKLKMFVVENDWLPGMNHGWGNGYVVIPEGHPFHGKGYDDIDVVVHGGLTFAEAVSELKNWPQVENLSEEDKDSWVIGFDTAHYQDTAFNWTKIDVIEETERLLKQCEGATSTQPLN